MNGKGACVVVVARVSDNVDDGAPAMNGNGGALISAHTLQPLHSSLYPSPPLLLMRLLCLSGACACVVGWCWGVLKGEAEGRVLPVIELTFCVD